MKRTAGLMCPADPAHGPLLEIDGQLRCVHVAHDGRPSTHKQGAAPGTRSRFTADEAITGTLQAAPRATQTPANAAEQSFSDSRQIRFSL